MDRTGAGSGTGISIGTLSVATGIPVETLRTWERRYGFPEPIGRTEGSHRRYGPDTVAKLRLISRALALGSRVSEVVGKSDEELKALIRPAPEALADRPSNSSCAQAVQRLLEHVQRLDPSGLRLELLRMRGEMAVPVFLDEVLGPFIVRVGELWSEGQLRIAEEHWVSQVVEDFARSQWVSLAASCPADTSPWVVLATPPGERHELGLHMAAWVLALGGVCVLCLGSDIPIEEVLYAAQSRQALAVVFSVSSCQGLELREIFVRLRRQLPSAVQLVAGGAGSKRLRGLVREVNSFQELSTWLEEVVPS